MNIEFEEEEKEKLFDLSEKDLSLREIARELESPLREVRDFIFKNPAISDRLKNLALESKAFEMFDEGEKAKDLVKAGFCPADRAHELYQKYSELNEEGGENIEDKLATQIGLLGSRLSQLEIKIMDSTLLPKNLDCPNCSHEGRYAVALVCTRCENITLHTPDSHPQITSQSKPLLDHLTKGSDENDE